MVQATPATVLVVEDNQVTSQLLQFNLKRAGFQVLAAPDGQAALQLLREHAVDLIMTDHQMPRMCGVDFCRELRRDPQLADVIVFLCSAKGLELDTDALRRDLGIQRVFFKPFSPREIVTAVSDSLNQGTHCA